MAHVQGESLKVIAADSVRLLNSPATSVLLVVVSTKGVEAMDQPYSVQTYSVLADWLSKFHTWPEFIQALWIVAIPVTVLGVTWLTMRALRDLISLTRTKRHWRGHLIYGVYQDPQGRWMIYWHDRQPQELDWANPPPELIGRGEVIRGVFRSEGE